MPKESLGQVTKRRLFGVLFIVIVVGLVSLSIAIYAKVFTDTVDVTLKANHTGNQLLKDSDVKVRGLIVGSVKDVHADGADATVDLALEPDKVKEIPKNVSAQILPKTLFGEQYVSLIIPTDRQGQIAQGDTIDQDRSKGALEAQTVFDHLFPVLTAVRPADLNATLTALATALNGRGEKLGRTLVDLDTYLKGLNPHTKALVDDLKKLGQVAEEYDDVAPDIFDTLTNLQTTVKTVVEKQRGIDELFTTGTDASVVLSGFLEQNQSRLIAVTGQTAKIYPLLAEYSPEFPCLFEGVSNLADGLNKTIYDNSIHLSITLDASNQGKYVPGNQPKIVTGYGPNCFGLPHNVPMTDGKFQIPDKYRCLNDGAPLTDDPCAGGPSAAGMRSLNSSQENALVNSLIARPLGTTPTKVPAAATILSAPLLRGNEVTVK
ncbi:virulence factor Mce family protein [Jatrophihabitans endophyticus]|uniref:Virulence factor Mce family protein n=1 Tax=Jatrophihabitans endophyticus TaxID=1206085 RepID=A0A1M5GQQ5_9ACTN|nr:MCE family protein [Jatrophihabitans endophyticus]SHG05977.1 virulence factor Mce family protein [Jatrophihabitans endophyticus]